MGEGLLAKDFRFTGEWTSDHVEALETFLEDIVARHVTIKTGTYRGTGRVLSVTVSDLPGPPKLLVIQSAVGGTPFVTITAYPTATVTAWTNRYFVLAAVAAVNTQNTDYRYLIIA